MKKALIAIIVVLAALAAGTSAFVYWAWQHRETVESRRDTRKAVSKELREMPSEKVLPYLEELLSKKSLQVWFEKQPGQEENPWHFWTLRVASLTRVPYDYIGQLVEDQIIRFAGNDADRKLEVPRIREMLAFSEKLLPLCSENGANSLKERRLDGYFLCGDFDGAIKLIESGTVTTRTPMWCKGTAAKLRAHKAMEANDYKEAVKQLLVFAEFMLSDEQKDFEDCDPTTGLLYSREWVLARNYMRCSNMSGKQGDAAKEAEFKALAKKYFDSAVEKAKNDPRSLEAIKKEMKSAGL